MRSPGEEHLFISLHPLKERKLFEGGKEAMLIPRTKYVKDWVVRGKFEKCRSFSRFLAGELRASASGSPTGRLSRGFSGLAPPRGSRFLGFNKDLLYIRASTFWSRQPHGERISSAGGKGWPSLKDAAIIVGPHELNPVGGRAGLPDDLLRSELFPSWHLLTSLGYRNQRFSL